MVKLNCASNAGLLRRYIVFLGLMLLVVEILLIILRSIGARHNVECSAAAKCMRKCMGGGVLGYSRLFAVSFFLSMACLVTCQSLVTSASSDVILIGADVPSARQQAD